MIISSVSDMTKKARLAAPTLRASTRSARLVARLRNARISHQTATVTASSGRKPTIPCSVRTST